MDWMALITYSLPPAFLVQLINWVLNRKVNRAKGEQGAVEALMRVNADLSEIFQKQSDENKKLFIQCANLRRVAAMCNGCRYASICPALAELRRQQKSNQREAYANRQRCGTPNDSDNPLNGAPVAGRPPP